MYFSSNHHNTEGLAAVLADGFIFSVRIDCQHARVWNVSLIPRTGNGLNAALSGGEGLRSGGDDDFGRDGRGHGCGDTSEETSRKS